LRPDVRGGSSRSGPPVMPRRGPGTAAGPGPGARLAAGAMGAAAAVLPDDAGERVMLGDTGAHALGAALGAAVVAGNRRAGLLVHAVALVAAACCGDRVSALARTLPG
ncbi:hypothetical protein AB0A67_37995, partial [Streptomyces eurythermus]